MAERLTSSNLALKKRLINNEPFVYAHLIKYERPYKFTKAGKPNTDAKRYAYLTDGAVNIAFDDGSVDTNGNSNGSQTYIADKVMTVGSLSETIEPKATSITLTIGAESLNNSVTASDITMTSSTITVPNTDLAAEGFREGDKIRISGGSNSNYEVRVTGLTSNNTILNVANIDNTLATQNTGTSITLTIVSDELKGPLTELNDSATNKSYVNRDVWVYKVFLDPDDYTFIGNPVPVFKGIIASASIIDNPSRSLQVKWKINSHWGDFAAVNGRMSDDSIHRGLNSLGVPDFDIVKKEIYATDLGFAHANETINILATYKQTEKVTKHKYKKGFFGLGAKFKTYEVDEITEKEVDLNFSLQAKYIPVVYGIDKIAAKPIFVDTKATIVGDTTHIFMASTLCEGEIGGIYDLYVEGMPLICQNLPDYTERNTSVTSSADVVCRGRAELGDTLGGLKISGDGISGSTSTFANYPGSYIGGDSGFVTVGDDLIRWMKKYHTYNPSLANTTANLSAINTNGTGVGDIETIYLNKPNTVRLTVHTGKEDQLADNTLVSIAQAASSGDRFKRQNDYYDGDLEDYWGPNHFLSDTAYVVMDCEIAQDETSVPEIEYVVRGKYTDCYNYDYSYLHNPISTYSSEATYVDTDEADHFKVGDTVTIKNSASGNAVLNADVFIIDKWEIVGKNPDFSGGATQTRFRFSDAPDLGYVDGIPTITDFYMEKTVSGTNPVWHMLTSGHNPDSGTVPSALTAVTSNVTAPTDGPQVITVPASTVWTDLFSSYKDQANTVVSAFTDSNLRYVGFPFSYEVTGSGATLTMTGGKAAGGTTTAVQTIICMNQIQLANSASTTPDIYNGMKIKLTTETTDGYFSIQERLIEDYDGTNRIAQISPPWDIGAAPEQVSSSTYKYTIHTNKDSRVSVNPAIQLLDFVTSKTYGRGLDPSEDISLSDWLASARTCDSRGTQTLNLSTALDATAGDRYVLTDNGADDGNIIAMGRVQATIDDQTSVVMEECFGKFSRELQKGFRIYSVGDMIQTIGGYYRVDALSGNVNSNGTITNDTHIAALKAGTSRDHDTDSSGLTGPIVHIPIYKLGQSGSTNSKATTITGTNLSLQNKSGTSYYNETTYSIYNSDFVKYWRYLGWESHHQRWATRHQTSGTVDTSQALFDTVVGFLRQMNGQLTFEGGKFALRIATTTDTIASDIAGGGDTGYTIGSEMNARYITDDDIIGSISVKDAGARKSFNTANSTIHDPGSMWEGKAVSFFDSNFLQADKGVVKQGSLSQPAVCNYFNARINVENFLKKSRYNLTITFTLGPKALLLLAGDTIRVTNTKFNWTGKYFRITNIGYTADCKANITAEEYDDSFYTISPLSLPSVLNEDFSAPLDNVPGTPENLTANAPTNSGQVNLTWDNATGIIATNWTEIYSYTNGSGANPVLIGVVAGNVEEYTHTVGADATTYYYRIRHKRIKFTNNKEKILYGGYTAYANATTTLPSTVYDVGISPTTYVFQATNAGVITSPTYIQITATRQNLTNAVTWTADQSVTFYDAASDGNATTTGDVIYLRSGNYGSGYANLLITATVITTADERTAGAPNPSVTEKITIIRQNAPAPGAAGSDSKIVNLTAADYSIVYDELGADPDPSTSTNIQLTAASQNFDNPYFKFTGDGITDEGSYSDEVDPQDGTDYHTFPVPDSYFETPKSLKVSVQEGSSGGEVAFDTISIFAVKPGVPGITVGLDNSAHVFPAAFNGVVSSENHANSGCVIEAYEGATAILYEPPGTAAGTFTVAAVEGQTGGTDDITVGAISDTGATATVAAHSGMKTGVDTAYITYTISGKQADGTAFNVTKKQTFSKSPVGGTGLTGGEVDIIFRRLATKPDTPSASSSTPQDWYSNVDNATGNLMLWSSFGSKAAGVTNFTWQTPEPVSGQATAEITVYKRASSVPDEPGGGGTNGVWSFATNTLTTLPHGGWSLAIPADDGNPCYASIALAVGIPLGTDDTLTWLDPPVVVFDTGDDGATGPRTVTGYIYYQSSSGSQPGGNNAVSTSSVTYNFSTGLLAGGVIGTGSTNWNQNAPTFTGSNANKYWYAYFSVIEATYTGSYTVSFSVPYEGQNFTGLVTFTGTNTISDGTNTTVSLVSGDLGSSGTTQIDGGRILTGYVSAARISVGDIDTADLNNDAGFTDDTAANTKTTVFRATSAPTALKIGDIWIDTDDGNKMYQATATGTGSWVAAQDGDIATAQSTADGKNQIFRQNDVPTSGVKSGDMWIDLNDGDKVYIAMADGADAITAGEWVASEVTTVTQTNTQDKTGGSIGGWALSSTTITSGNITLNNATNQIIISDTS